jgi:diacylglycerol kinase
VSAAFIDDHTHRAHPHTQGGVVKSFQHAIHGVVHIVRHERNARIHLGMAILALLAGVLFQLSNVELAAVFFAIILVFLAEIFNTAIERTLDLIDSNENARIKLIKDMAAGGVLVAAVAASAMGAVIFIPHMVGWIWVI